MKKNLLLFLSSCGILFGESISTITVTSDEEKDSTNISAQKITADDIQSIGTKNSDIASALEANPNITISGSSSQSKNAASITPQKISINGGKFYQNNFNIDGISNDSLLDPALDSADQRKDTNHNDVSGNESNFFLDLDLVEEIKIYDSLIPARYGSFTGGVIDVKTKRA